MINVFELEIYQIPNFFNLLFTIDLFEDIVRINSKYH